MYSEATQTEETDPVSALHWAVIKFPLSSSTSASSVDSERVRAHELPKSRVAECRKQESSAGHVAVRNGRGTVFGATA